MIHSLRDRQAKTAWRVKRGTRAATMRFRASPEGAPVVLSSAVTPLTSCARSPALVVMVAHTREDRRHG